MRGARREGSAVGAATPAPRAPGRGALTVRAALAALFALGSGCGSRDHQAASFDPDSIPDRYRHPTAALAVPGASRAFEITPGGDLTNGDWAVVMRPSCAGAVADSPRVIAYEERWRPVARWRRRAGNVRWDFEAVALPSPAPRDTGLLVSLEVHALNASETACEARLVVKLEELGAAPAFVAWDAPDPRPAPLRWANPGTDAAEAWADAPAAGDSCATSVSLAPHQSRRVRFVFPAYPAPARDLAVWARVPHARRADESRRFWTRQLAGGTRWTLGDPEVERAIAAAEIVLLSCRERRGEAWVPIGNPFQYRDVWLRDGARAIHALAVTGHTAAARDLAAGLLGFQWTQGAFLSQRGQLDGTGQALWAFEQALLRPAADASAGRFADAALRAWRWSEWQREMGRASGWPFGRMMPFADPRDAELTRAQLVGNDAWAIAGYRATLRLARAAGRAAAADSVEASLARYLGDFASALVITGSPDVPPSWQGVGRDWGNLACAWPCGALAPGDPRCAALARRVWASAGGAGPTWYGTSDSLQYYVGADLGSWALLTGRRAQADSILDALLEHRTASGGAGEIFTRDAHDFGGNLPPHATSAAALLALIRNSLVFDDADTLALTLGARVRWWRGASVARAPTRWGAIDLAFRREAASAEWRWSAVPVWTALTLPPGAVLADPPAAPLHGARGGTVVLAPPGTTRARAAIVDRAHAPSAALSPRAARGRS